MSVTMSDLLGASAEPIVLEHNGRTYRAQAITQHLKSKVERWLRKLAWDDLYALREEMPAELYEQVMSSLIVNRAKFAWLGEVFWKELGTERGGVGLVAILFGITEVEAAALAAARPKDVAAATFEAILESLPGEQEALMREKLKEHLGRAGAEGLPAGVVARAPFVTQAGDGSSSPKPSTPPSSPNSG